MQALLADASPSGEWSMLAVDGDRWVYSWESTEDGKKIFWRNINTFSGADKIHSRFSASPQTTPGKPKSPATSAASNNSPFAASRCSRRSLLLPTLRVDGAPARDFRARAFLYSFWSTGTLPATGG